MMGINSLFLYGLALITGALIPVQAVTNAMLNKATGDILYSSLILFVVGIGLVSVLILICRPTLPTVGQLVNAPVSSYAGGLIVATYVLSITFLTPKIGVGNAVLLIVTGQVLSSALIDHYGLFGAKIFPLNFKKLIGLLSIIFGLVMVNYSQANTPSN